MNNVSIMSIIAILTISVFVIMEAPSLSAQQGYYDKLRYLTGDIIIPYEIYQRNTYPSPGEGVPIEIHSIGGPIDNIRTIQWTVNGEVVKEFANKRKVNVIADSSPKEVTANILYFNESGGREQRSITQIIRPVIFDILWEGDAVTTPLYKGHKLAGPGTPIRLSAHIQYIDERGALHTEKDFSFLWEIESRYQEEQGAGVSAITYERGGSRFNDSLSVRVRATLVKDNSIVAERFISIPVTDPVLLVYPYTLLHGLSHNRVVPRRVNTAGDSAILSAYPFYFSKGDFLENKVQYNWFVDNKPKPLKEGRKIDISITGQLFSVPLKLVAMNENEREQLLSNSIIFNI